MPPIRRCVNCQGLTKRGTRCSRRTCKTFPYCWQHLLSECGLKVKRSTIPGAGQGLFAVKDFKAGTRISRYTGDIRRKGFESDYAFGCPWGVINAERTNTFPARYANKRTKRFPTNAKLTCDNRNHRGSIKATKNIRASRAQPREIFVAYGPGFRF